MNWIWSDPCPFFANPSSGMRTHRPLVPALNDTEAVGPNEVLALPSNISDGVASPASSAMPAAARIGAEVELQDTAVPIAFHLRGAYGPSLSQMYADQGSQPASEAYLPRAPLRSHAEYLEFCRCFLDEDIGVGVKCSTPWTSLILMPRYSVLPSPCHHCLHS